MTIERLNDLRRVEVDLQLNGGETKVVTLIDNSIDIHSVSEYLEEQYGRLTKQLADSEFHISSFKSHGIRRSRSEIINIQKQRTKEAGKIRHALDVFTGKTSGLVEILTLKTPESMKIVGFKVLTTDVED